MPIDLGSLEGAKEAAANNLHTRLKDLISDLIALQQELSEKPLPQEVFDERDRILAQGVKGMLFETLKVGAQFRLADLIKKKEQLQARKDLNERTKSQLNDLGSELGDL
jgi:hypothetical protein